MWIGTVSCMPCSNFCFTNSSFKWLISWGCPLFFLILTEVRTSLFHDHKQVLSRLAPFERGIYEDYVANFWCSTSIFIKWKRLFTIQLMKFLSFITTISAFLPSFIQQVKAPSDHGFLYALLNSSFSFYLFSYQGMFLKHWSPLTLSIISHNLISC